MVPGVGVGVGAGQDSRTTYLLHTLRRLGFLYVLLDLSRTYVHTDAYLLGYTPDYAPLSATFPRYLIPVWTQFVRPLLDVGTMGIQSWAFIELQYLLLSLICIFILGQNPSLWPPLFGNLRDAWTLRGVWRKVWHQMLWPTVAPWGRFAENVVFGSGGGRAPRKTARFLVRNLVGFGISTLGHSSATYLVSQGRLWRRSALFFGMQVVGVVLEAGVLWVFRNTEWGRRRVRGKWGGRWIGYLWVGGWFAWTGRWQAVEMREIGLARTDPVGWSLIRWGLGWEQEFVWRG